MKVKYIRKKSGGQRRIHVPTRREKDEVRALAYNLFVAANEELPDSVHGFRTGRSPVTNGAAHIGRDVTVSLDLKDFFDTVTPWFFQWHTLRDIANSPLPGTIPDELKGRFPKINKAIEDLMRGSGGGRPRVFHLLFPWNRGQWSDLFFKKVNEVALARPNTNQHRRYLRYYPYVVGQGMPTSPLIANVSMRFFDVIMEDWFKAYGGVYTRYADDLTISFQRLLLRESPKDMMGWAERTVISLLETWAPFIELNPKKTRVQCASNGRRIITGVSVGETDVRASRRTRRKLRAAQHQGNEDQAQGFSEWCAMKTPQFNPHNSTFWASHCRVNFVNQIVNGGNVGTW